VAATATPAMGRPADLPGRRRLLLTGLAGLAGHGALLATGTTVPGPRRPAREGGAAAIPPVGDGLRRQRMASFW